MHFTGLNHIVSTLTHWLSDVEAQSLTALIMKVNFIDEQHKTIQVNIKFQRKKFDYDIFQPILTLKEQ